MAVKIYTIPIREAFSEKDGCPFCRLFDKLEESTLSYTLGAAMMEPDVRIEMNRLGFCTEHLSRMAAMKNKLSLALILESHLDTLRQVLETPPSEGKKTLFSASKIPVDLSETLRQQAGTCFVCEKIQSTKTRYFSNAVYMWDTDASFRSLLLEQPWLCISHAAMLLTAGRHELKSKLYSQFYQDVVSVVRQRLEAISKDVSAFCVSFDHRNAGKPLGEERHCIEKAIQLLK